MGPFDDVKGIYDSIAKGLKPLGLKLDYERIKKNTSQDCRDAAIDGNNNTRAIKVLILTVSLLSNNKLKMRPARILSWSGSLVDFVKDRIRGVAGSFCSFDHIHSLTARAKQVPLVVICLTKFSLLSFRSTFDDCSSTFTTSFTWPDMFNLRRRSSMRLNSY